MWTCTEAKSLRPDRGGIVKGKALGNSQFIQSNILVLFHLKGWKNKIGYWCGCWKMKGKEKMPFRQKAGPTDGWAPYWLSGQEKRWEDSNAAWAWDDKPIFCGGVILWHLPEWASFYPSLPRPFPNCSFIDTTINHIQISAKRVWVKSFITISVFRPVLNFCFMICSKILQVGPVF